MSIITKPADKQTGAPKNLASLPIDELLDEYIERGIKYKAQKLYYCQANMDKISRLEDAFFEVEQEIKSRLKTTQDKS